MIRNAALMLRDRSGAAAAEMALMLPLLLVLLFTMFEGGHYLWTEHKVVTGVRDASRFAARLPLSTFLNQDGSGVYSCNSGVTDPALTQIKRVARTGTIDGTVSRVIGWTDAQTTVSVPSCTAAGGMYNSISGQAPRITISAAVPYPSLFGALGFSTATVTLTASSQSPVVGL